MKIRMLHGSNHNMFGKRDPAQYGTITLGEINASLTALGQALGSCLLALRAGVSAATAAKDKKAACA
jgi:3-dehydroquinate dehydratase